MSRLGVARKYQSPSVFDEFTVRDNLRTAMDGKRTVRQLLRNDPRDDERIDALATELGLADHSDRRPGISRTVIANGSRSG